MHEIVRDWLTRRTTIGRIGGEALTAQTILEQIAPVFVTLGTRVLILWPQSTRRRVQERQWEQLGARFPPGSAVSRRASALERGVSSSSVMFQSTLW